MPKELRLSKIVNNITDGDLTEDAGGGGGYARTIQIGTVTYGNTPSVRAETFGGVTTLYFTLVPPISDASVFMATLSEMDHNHVIDRITLTSIETTSLSLSEKPNRCPVIVMVAGKTFAEVNNDFFTVNRSNKTITWNPDKTGIRLKAELAGASTVYIHYETSRIVGHRKENITLSSITTNTITLTNTPNSTKAMVIINGVCYFEDKDFTINRSTRVLRWSATNTGFSISSGNLSGYLTVCYDVDLPDEENDGT